MFEALNNQGINLFTLMYIQRDCNDTLAEIRNKINGLGACERLTPLDYDEISNEQDCLEAIIISLEAVESEIKHFLN